MIRSVKLVDILTGKKTFQKIGNAGFIRLIDVMPRLVDSERPTADSAIAQAARVSYGDGTKSVSDDRGLLRYLMRHAHTSPFEMVELKFHIRLPMFIARQWIRHRTANVNEISGRYSVLSNDFYEPEAVYYQSNTNKQCSGEQVDPEVEEVFRNFTNIKFEVYKKYQDVLNYGVSREQARIMLPLSTYTEWYWKCDLHNILRFIRLRSHPTAQKEIRDYSDAMLEMVREVAPFTTEAYTDYTMNAVTFSKSDLDHMHGRQVMKNKSELRELKEKLKLI